MTTLINNASNSSPSLNAIRWLEDWLKKQGDQTQKRNPNTVKIYTTSNPGWYISIRLGNTALSTKTIKPLIIEYSENDWYGYHIKDGMFNAFGDLKKLNLLLDRFRYLTEENIHSK